jgi:hypothetical protein
LAAGGRWGNRSAIAAFLPPAAVAAELIRLGASVQGRILDDDPDDPIYYVVIYGTEGNEFCVG